MKKLLLVLIVISISIFIMNGCIFGPDDEKNDGNNVAELENVDEKTNADQNQDTDNPSVAQQIENPISLRVLVARTDIDGNFVKNFENVTIWTNDPKHQAVVTDADGVAILTFPEGTRMVKIEADCGWTQRATSIDLLNGYESLCLQIYPYENLVFLPVKVVRVQDGSSKNYEGVTVWSNAALEYVDGVKTNAVNTNAEGMATLAFSKHAGEVKVHTECGWTKKILTVNVFHNLNLLLVQIK